MKLNISKEDIFNFVTGMEYLRDRLEAEDVSGDFAPDPETSVSAWQLLTDTAVYQVLSKAAKAGEYSYNYKEDEIPANN